MRLVAVAGKGYASVASSAVLLAVSQVKRDIFQIEDGIMNLIYINIIIYLDFIDVGSPSCPP